jgi:hypothetical protein
VFPSKVRAWYGDIVVLRVTPNLDERREALVIILGSILLDSFFYGERWFFFVLQECYLPPYFEYYCCTLQSSKNLLYSIGTPNSITSSNF